VGVTPAHPTRRTLVRTAANTVWAVPVITVAGTAPAYAGSQPAPQVRASGLDSSRVGDFITVTVTVTNETVTATTGLLLAVRFTDSVTATMAQTAAPTVLAGGFAFVNIDSPVEASDRTYNFVKTDPQLTGSGDPTGATDTLSFRVRTYPLQGDTFLGTIQATPTPTGPAGGTGIAADPHVYT
jgi:hypothetical protein